MHRFVVAVSGSAACISSAVVVLRRDGLNVSANSNPDSENGPRSWDYNWDQMDTAYNKKLDSTDSKESTSKASRTLILIRHGQYVWDPVDKDKRVLTELGREQAHHTGLRLKAIGSPYNIIYYSTMPRATETAQIISRSLPDVPMKSCDLLQEGAPIRPIPIHKKWKPEAYEFFRDGPRIEAAFRKYFHRAPPSQTEDSIEVIVCHANVIRYFICRALQLPPEAWLRISLANASITKVVCRPNGTVTLKALSNSGHLPPEMVTFA